MENLIRKQSITTAIYSEDLRRDWDDFVTQEAINSTFLHSRDFFDHNPLNVLDDSSLIFYKNKKIVAVLPAVSYFNEGRYILHSHLRATYGGFIIEKKIGVQDAIELLDQTILFSKERNIGQIIIRNPFRIFHSINCDETNYAMWNRGFEIKSRELEIAVRLYANVSETRAQYHNDVARNVKKAQKYIRVKPIENLEDLEEFWILLERCYLERHGKKPVHNYESIVSLIESVGKEKILCFGAYSDLRLVGGCVIFVANHIVLHGQYIAFDVEYQHLKPVHALIDHALEYGSKNGFRYFNFGMANENEGKKINYGLFTIKEHFGGRGLLRETMYLNIN